MVKTKNGESYLAEVKKTKKHKTDVHKGDENKGQQSGAELNSTAGKLVLNTVKHDKTIRIGD